MFPDLISAGAVTSMSPKSNESEALRKKLAEVLQEVRSKNSPMTISEMKDLLYRCTATLLHAEKVRVQHHTAQDNTDS